MLRASSLRFALSGLIVVTACVLVLRATAAQSNAAVAAWGATFDLTITIPLLYWFFVVRAGKARPLTIAPVFIAGTLLATLLIPRAEQQFVRQLRMFVVPAAELVLITAFARRPGRIGAFVTAEARMFQYALFSWRKKPEEGTSFHERNGWASIVACIVVLIVAESIGMHLLLRLWKPRVAWLWTALDLWAIAWLLGDYHALRLRRTTLDDDTLHLRFGMRWSADIARTNIASVTQIHDEREWKQRDVLRVAILEPPRWLIALREPVVVEGLAGLRKTVRAIAILPDDDELVRRLAGVGIE
ncbi:MAG TPA: hypothetical protein VJZ00_22425 [Thermoanaerobaculia bacterium]|nr:hypothetical protein [Thermoanaerobaculia bacterium]